MPRVTVFKDQTGAAGKERHIVQSGKCLADLIPELIPDFETGRTRVMLNCKELSLPSFDDLGNCIDVGDEFDMTRPLGDSDNVIITLETKGFDPFTYMLIAIVVSAGVSMLMMRNMNADQGNQSRSSNNSFYGQENSARPYQAIPDMYGTNVSYPDLASSEPVQRFVGDRKTITQFHTHGIGFYELTGSPRLGNTLIDQIAGAGVETFEADENGITTIPDYEEHFSINEVDGQELIRTDIDATVQAKVHYVNPSEDTGKITIEILEFLEPSFLFNVGMIIDILSTSAPNLVGSYMISNLIKTKFRIGMPGMRFRMLRIEVFLSNVSTVNPNWSDYTTEQSGISVEIKSLRDHQVGPYDTAIPANDVLIDLVYPTGLNGDVVYNVTIQAVDRPGGNVIQEIPEFFDTFTHSGLEASGNYDRRAFTNEFNYNGDEPVYMRITLERMTPMSVEPDQTSKAQCVRVAVSRVEINKQFSNGETMSVLTVNEIENPVSPRSNRFNIEMTRKTISYDLANGVVDYELRPSRKFADALLHEYHIVFGLPVNRLDLDGLYSIQQFIDARQPELGEFCYTFDDIDMGLEDRIQIICDVARVIVFKADGMYRFHRDQKQQFPAYAVTKRDMAADRNFSRTWKTSMPTQSDGIKLEYVDSIFNEKAYIFLTYDADGNVVDGKSMRPFEMRLLGCRNELQARNRARLEMEKMKHDYWSITDTLLNQAIPFDFGQMIEYCDVYRNDIFSGEIMAINRDTMEIKLSEDVFLEPGSLITITDIFGEPRGPAPVYEGSSSRHVILDDEEQMAAVYTANQERAQLGSRFIISVDQEKVPERVIVVEKNPSNDGETVQVGFETYSDDNYLFEDGFNSPIFFRELEGALGAETTAAIACSGISANGFTILTAHNGVTGTISSDRGLSWSLVESNWGLPTLVSPRSASVVDSEKFYVSFNLGYAVKSVDGGETCVQMTRYLNSGYDTSTDPSDTNIISMDSDTSTGSTVVALFQGGRACISRDSGENWNLVNEQIDATVDPGPNRENMVFVSDNAQNITIASGSRLLYSKDNGVTWTNKTLTTMIGEGGQILASSISNNGNMLFFIYENGIAYSSDGGDTFTKRSYTQISSMQAGQYLKTRRFSISGDGMRIIIAQPDGHAVSSADFGISWTTLPLYLSGQNKQEITSVSISDDGNTVFAGFRPSSGVLGDWLDTPLF